MNKRMLKAIEKSIAALLIVVMLFTSNGFTTLAANEPEDVTEQNEESELIIDSKTVMDSASADEIDVCDSIEEEEQDFVYAQSGTINGIDWSIDNDGNLTVTGSGNIKDGTISPSDWPWYSYRETIKSATVSVTGLKSTRKMFYGCKNMTTVDIKNLDFSQVESMVCMFENCTNLESVDFGNANTSKVTSMMSLFLECEMLKSVNVSSFDTSNVTHMGSMFAGCYNLKELDISNFKTNKVTSMAMMFDRCQKLASIKVNATNFDTSNVTLMNKMFHSCNVLMDLDTSKFKTSNVTSMAEMFNGCRGLVNLDVSGFDTTKVTSMDKMFYNCDNLQSIDMSSFDMSNTTVVTDMFGLDSGLTSKISLIETPKNLKGDVKLPKTSQAWQNENGSAATYLPKNESTSHTYKVASVSGTKHTITIASCTNGTITATKGITNNKIELSDAEGVTFTFTPSTGYHLADVKVGSTSVMSSVTENNTYTITNLTQDITISATFAEGTIDKKEKYAITIGANKYLSFIANGVSMTSAGGSIEVEEGEDFALTIIPEDGYKVSKIVDNNDEKEGATSYSLTNVTKNHTIQAYAATAEGETKKYIITVEQPENGKILYKGEIPTNNVVEIEEKQDATFTIEAITGYEVQDIMVDNISELSSCTKEGEKYTYVIRNISASKTISAVMVAKGNTEEFANIQLPSTFEHYSITASLDIDSNKVIKVRKGENVKLTITPDDGYMVSSVKVGAEDKGAIEEVTLTSVQEDCTIAVTVVETEKVDVTITSDANCAIKAMVNNKEVNIVSNVFKAEKGKDVQIIITPDSGYKIEQVLIDGVDQGYQNTHTISKIDKATTISVKIVAITPDTQYYQIGWKKVANGSVKALTSVIDKTVTIKVSDTYSDSVNSYTEIEEGRDAVIEFVPDEGYEVDKVYVNQERRAVSDNKITISEVASNYIVTVSFKEIDVPREDVYYTIKVDVINGSATGSPEKIVDGSVSVLEHSSEVIKIVGLDNYLLKTLIVDGKDVTDSSNMNVVFEDIAENHEISAEFVEDTPDNIIKISFALENGEEISISVNSITGEVIGKLPENPKQIGLVFDGWYTQPTGGEKITEKTLKTLSDGQKLYPRWVNITIVEKQKIDVSNYLNIYFGDALNKYLEQNPKGKYKYDVITISPEYASSKATIGSINKLGVIAKKTGVLTAKKAGTVEIRLALYNAETKSYESSKESFTISIVKLITKSQVLTYIGQSVEADQYIDYGYSEFIGSKPNCYSVSGLNDVKVEYSSSKSDVATVDPVTGQVVAKKNGTAKIKVIYSVKIGTNTKGADIYSKVSKVISVSVKTPTFKKATFVVKQGAKPKKNILNNVKYVEKVTYSSDNLAIATVDSSTGMVTGLRKGETARITATVTSADGHVDKYSYFVQVQ